MAEQLTCTLCGSSNFTKEAGFYYCNECQTQSQEIQEHVLASAPDDNDLSKLKVAKRIKTGPKQEDQLTSWECYNYVILGLVNELIKLGANPRLKRTVKLLWFKYLRKLEVLNDDPTALPKLSAFNSKTDAEIIYGRRAAKKRRRRSRSSTPSSSDSSGSKTDSVNWKRERAKHRRSLVTSQYDELSTTQASEDVSLHNQSLSSLRSTPDSTKERKYLRYNKFAMKELLNQMTKNHLKNHCRDIHCDLDCHNLTYRSLSVKYKNGPHLLSRKKVYALIYLGLLINKDKIQLGDLLRFIREGNISFHYVNHFFPEELQNKNLNIKFWNYGTVTLCHRRMREAAAMLAKYIGVTKYIPQPNLIDLCQRYCHELNLPEEVWAYTLNLISRVPSKMQLTQQSRIIPNFEGRVISLIMFVLKLFFGLDDRTEYKFSSDAGTLNTQNLITNSQGNYREMFVWKDWVHYIHYRKLVLMQHHFPTRSLFDDDNVHDSHLFLGFINEQNLKYEKDEPHPSKDVDILKGLLRELAAKQAAPKQTLQFRPSITPFRDYISAILETRIPENYNYLMTALQKDYKNSSLDFLAKPLTYFNILSNGRRVGIKHRGVNKNLEIVNIRNPKNDRQNWREHAKKSTYVRLVNRRDQIAKQFPKKENSKEDNTKVKSKTIIKGFENYNMKLYKKRIRKLIKIKNSTAADISISIESNTSLSQTQHSQPSQLSKNEDDSLYLHYNPDERYWLKSRNTSEVSKEEFSEFISSFPESFRFVLNECGRVTEQSSKDLYDEYRDVEVYLCYVARYSKKDVRDKIVNLELTNLIKKATKNW